MKALLIYNPNAGGGAENQAREFQKLLEAQGYRPTYRATQQEEDLDRILPEADGLVVVVGGDGTLRAVATRLVDRDLPIALIPNGTANNVGRTLGIEGSPYEVLQGLRYGHRRRVDLGRLRLPWGESYFLEGAGLGLYAQALSSYRPKDGKSFLRGLKTLMDLLNDMPSRRATIRLDGEEEEGEYLLVEAMNMGAIGPRLTLAPGADPGDGWLEVLRLRTSEKASYLAYLRALLNQEISALENVATTKVRKLEILWDGFPLHQDASCLETAEPLKETWVTIDLLDGCLEFLLPREPPDPEP